MAEEQKPISLTETAPVVAAPVVEPVAETKPADETPAETPVETATEETTAAPVEEAKEEVKPIEAGTLEHKGAPANFPKNLLYAKNHFWFGSDSVEKEKLATYLKHEKASDVAHHVVSWAAETGKGLLFYAKEADKSTPTGVIQLSEATEPTTDGTNKFHFTAKGHKHAFKAPTAADRDAWVEQLKLKIAEAKELAATVTESETYKNTLETLKPAPASKKEDKPAAVATEAATEETPKEATEEAKEEEKKEELKEEKKEEPKRRSASRKRGSIFGNLLGKKEEVKKETAAEDKPAETEGTANTEVTPIEQLIQATETAAEATTTEAATTEAAPAEENKEVKEPVKPVPSKRASLFGGLSFGKKKSEPESAPTTPAKEEPTATTEEPVAETAPVIPAVETTEPLSAEVSSPATVPTETTEVAPVTNGETKKEVKSDKRKSSLPFTFGKKDKAEKSATSDEEGEKKSTPFFSKFRQTVKKNKAEKSVEETAAEDKPAESSEVAAEPVAEAAIDSKTEDAKVDEPATTEAATIEKPVAAPAPVIATA